MGIINLGHIVDTLKINANFQNEAFIKITDYQNADLEKEVKEFNKKVDKLIELKKVASEIKNHDNQMRFKPTDLNGLTYRVMATASASYSVILQNGDISIFLRKFSKKVKNPVLKVEFRAEYLARVGYLKAVQQVQRLIRYEFISNPVEKVKEIHLACDIQGYEFTPLDFYRIRTLSRNRVIYTGDEKNCYLSNQRFTGMTFGKGDFMLRIYNKTFEITKNKKKGFIQSLHWVHNPKFDKNQNVWRIEGQIRRDKLKELSYDLNLENSSQKVNLENLTDVLNNIPSIWRLFNQRYLHKSIEDNLIQEQIQGFKYLKKGGIKFISSDLVKKRFQKAEVSNLWKTIEKYNNYEGKNLDKFEDIKKPEVEYVENAYKALISTTTKLLRGNFSTDLLIDIILNANDKYFNKNGTSIIQNARLNALDYLSSAKYYYQQNGYCFSGFDEYEKDMIENLKQLMDISVIAEKYPYL